MHEVTRILNAIDQGDPHAAEQLLPLGYQELRKLASQRLAQERPGQTLQATALVHEAYVRLAGPTELKLQWNSRGHFFAAAAEAMRRILVEAARRKRSVRHGGELRRVAFDEQLHISNESCVDLLDRLATEEPEVAEIVELRYFAGLTIEETSLASQLSARTVNRHRGPRARLKNSH